MAVVAIISGQLEAMEVYVVAINVTLGQCDWVILEFMLENIAMSCMHCDIAIVYCITPGNIIIQLYVRKSKTHKSGHLFVCQLYKHVLHKNDLKLVESVL